MTTTSTTLILGASRGLGLALVEEWLKRDAQVIATQRSASPGLSALQVRYPGNLEIEVGRHCRRVLYPEPAEAPERAPH